jgi:hypothetical protein
VPLLAGASAAASHSSVYYTLLAKAAQSSFQMSEPSLTTMFFFLTADDKERKTVSMPPLLRPPVADESQSLWPEIQEFICNFAPRTRQYTNVDSRSSFQALSVTGRKRQDRIVRSGASRPGPAAYSNS